MFEILFFVSSFFVCATTNVSSRPPRRFTSLQDLNTELKRRLNDKIEFELAKQGWEALSSQLGMNDHLNVRLLRMISRVTARHR